MNELNPQSPELQEATATKQFRLHVLATYTSMHLTQVRIPEDMRHPVGSTKYAKNLVRWKNIHKYIGEYLESAEAELRLSTSSLGLSLKPMLDLLADNLKVSKQNVGKDEAGAGAPVAVAAKALEDAVVPVGPDPLSWSYANGVKNPNTGEELKAWMDNEFTLNNMLVEQALRDGCLFGAPGSDLLYLKSVFRVWLLVFMRQRIYWHVSMVARAKIAKLRDTSDLGATCGRLEELENDKRLRLFIDELYESTFRMRVEVPVAGDWQCIDQTHDARVMLVEHFYKGDAGLLGSQASRAVDEVIAEYVETAPMVDWRRLAENMQFKSFMSEVWQPTIRLDKRITGHYQSWN